MNKPARKSAVPRRSTARKAGEATRERMLDAAEALFAAHGYHGTSLRDVARQIDVAIALVTYHFSSKENLLDQVVERRASYMALCRIKALDEARSAAGDDPVSLRKLIEGYVWPFIERSSCGDPGWKNYTHLVARLANSPSWLPVISRHYDSVARQFVVEFKRSLSGVSEADVIHAFSFMAGTMISAVAESGRIGSLSLGKHTGADLEALFRLMVPFLEAGFNSLRKADSPG